MYPIKNATAITVPFFAHDVNGDGVTGLVDGGFTKRISKNGGAFAAMTVTITEMENGWYSFPLSTAHSDTNGILSISFSHASTKRVNLQWRVETRLIDDLATPTNITAATGITVSTNSDKTGYALSATGIDAIPYTATGAVALAKATWTDALTTYTNGMAGKRLKGISAVPAIDGTINDASATTTSFITTLTGYGTNFFVDAILLVEYAADKWQANVVTTYTSATGAMTFAEAFYAAPSNGLNIAAQMTHVHPIAQIQSGLATAAALTTVDDFLDTEIADIQARLPAALTAGGNIKADVLAITGDTGAATKLERVLSGNTTGTVGTGSTTTSVVTSSLNPAASVTDQFKGLIIKFDDATTTAALRGQGTDITASTAAGVLTCTALTTSPVSGDTFTVS